MGWIIREHVQAGTPEVGLNGAVLVQNIVVNLACAIDVRKVDEPVAPAPWVVDRERTDERRTRSKSFKNDPLGGSEPCVFADRGFVSSQAGRLDSEGE